jgi:hypothetical protein
VRVGLTCCRCCCCTALDLRAAGACACACACACVLGGGCGERMEESGRGKEAAPPPWAPSRSTAFRLYPYAATGGDWAEAPSARGNGVAARSSNLRAVRKRPVRFLHLPFSRGYPQKMPGLCFAFLELLSGSPCSIVKLNRAILLLKCY